MNNKVLYLNYNYKFDYNYNYNFDFELWELALQNQAAKIGNIFIQRRVFNKKLLTKWRMDEKFTICGLWYTKVENHKSEIAKKMGAGSFPHSHYPLSIIHYFFTTLRTVTPCGTVIRSV